jgi:hypothetical protein
MASHRPLTLLLLVGAALLPTDAAAQDPQFGQFDIPTVFYISKSDDKNRVDYGIRLDQRCAPVKDESVFQYWRHFQPPDNGTQTHLLGTFEYIPYGISEQRSLHKTQTGGVHLMKLRQFDKTPIAIITKKEADGKCTSQARAIINGKEAELTYIYVKLGKGGLVPSVDYVDVHGKDLETGADISARMNKP